MWHFFWSAGPLPRWQATMGSGRPAGREPAGALRVNVHTVAPAYQLLERDGVLERQRGDAYRAAAAAQAAAELLAADIDQLIERAAAIGVSAEALVDMIAAGGAAGLRGRVAG